MLVSSLGSFLGAFIAVGVNTAYQRRFENVDFPNKYIWRKDAWLGSIARGILAGCAALAIGSVDRGYLESFSLLFIFTYAFFYELLFWCEQHLDRGN